MKNIFKKLLAFGILLICLTGCEDTTNEEYKEVLKVSDTLGIYSYYGRAEENKNIYSSFESITYDEKELNSVLVNHSVKLDEIVEKMKTLEVEKDKESKYYQDGKVYVAVCNTSDNKNIYISDNLDSIKTICKFNPVNTEKCVASLLKSYITSTKVTQKGGKVTNLSSNKNYDKITYKKSSLGEYVIVKTSDSKLLKDIRSYFKKKNKKYYEESYTYYQNEPYYVFFYNKKSKKPSIAKCLTDIYPTSETNE